MAVVAIDGGRHDLSIIKLKLISVLIPDEGYLLKDITKNELLLLWTPRWFFVYCLDVKIQARHRREHGCYRVLIG